MFAPLKTIDKSVKQALSKTNCKCIKKQDPCDCTNDVEKDVEHTSEKHHQNKKKIDECCVKNITSFKTPLDAYNNSPKEELLYTVALPVDLNKPDHLVTIDVNPKSPTYCKVIGQLPMPHVGDELHHTGWNACISCKGDQSLKHKYLILPSMVSGNIYVVDVLTDPKNPKLHKEISGELIKEKVSGSYPHTSHCLPNGDVMISLMGGKNKDGRGGFLILDGETFDIKGRWEKAGDTTQFGYDFWYQPNFNVMVSSEFGEPQAFMEGFNPTHVAKRYGDSLTFWNWNEKTVKNKVCLGQNGLIPLECRFAHDPKKNYGFVGVALSTTVVRFYQESQSDKFTTEQVISIQPIRVKNWALEQMPGLITDILISLDDRFLYITLWLHGSVQQYNIENPRNPKLVGEIYLGGSLRKDGNVIPLDENGNERPDLLKEIPTVKGHKLQGAPQMIQLSRDGQRLYVSSSLLRPWDKQFYPEMAEKGGQIIQLDVNTKEGGLSLNKDFYVNFEDQPFGPAVAHEMRYPGGDCSSDIWV
ncbi:hypothetical protein PPERSA_08414 [Pseudocohnilembus persalinus]|uniref:Methanethiol oxidase n=1 Tax=Pseudocohnilembus persalinus TaxID=266149 RepID=A0A0V0R6B6_PSEPJ|nr:hypothetical protein PPERSA_08414 [Pseudocohnilembus persalinus]|eukprot:KRX10011.1 hypothetical protein PPERSA_08414 [Pseudocohnilembus persalinus]